MNCIDCIFDRLNGKTTKVLPLVLRTVKDAITVMEGVAVCTDHLAYRINVRQQRIDAQQAEALARAKAGLAAQAKAHGHDGVAHLATCVKCNPPEEQPEAGAAAEP